MVEIRMTVRPLLSFDTTTTQSLLSTKPMACVSSLYISNTLSFSNDLATTK